jgi:hypothetical protein
MIPLTPFKKGEILLVLDGNGWSSLKVLIVTGDFPAMGKEMTH